MVKAESTSTKNLLKAFVDNIPMKIGTLTYCSEVIKSNAYCYRCDFQRVKGLVSPYVSARVCGCCLMADNDLKSGLSHVLKLQNKTEVENEESKAGDQEDGCGEI